MINAELIAELSKYPAEMEVTISDGYKCVSYKGSYSVQEFEGMVDIGIGGTDWVEEE